MAFTEEISSATDDGTGYLIVHVPASPVAPHMVDNRYFGRGDKTKYQMGDAEVVSLHTRRRNIEADTLALLRKEMEEDPPLINRVQESKELQAALANQGFSPDLGDAHQGHRRARGWPAAPRVSSPTGHTHHRAAGAMKT